MPATAANVRSRSDFDTDEGQSLIRDLALHADVVVENFKVGGLKKYGLDYESLKAVNPRLVYCSITGFGQDGPYASRAGYDFMIQGMGGIMDLTGDPDGEPHKIGVAFADIFTGVYSVVGILAALRRRDETGAGAHLDMALLDVQTSVLANQAMNYLASGKTPRRMGNAHPNIVPYQVFPVADGHVIVAVGNDGQFARFVAVLGMPELAQDERFMTQCRAREPSSRSGAVADGKDHQDDARRAPFGPGGPGRSSRPDQQCGGCLRGSAGGRPGHEDRSAIGSGQKRRYPVRPLPHRDGRSSDDVGPTVAPAWRAYATRS